MSDLPGYDAWKTRAPEPPEGEECEECGGTGEVEEEVCEVCNGEGYIDPPTPQEIKETKQEIDADRKLSER